MDNPPVGRLFASRANVPSAVTMHLTPDRVRLVVLIAATWVLAIFGGKAALVYGYVPWVLARRRYEPPEWMLYLGLGLLVVSIVAMWLAYTRPALATAVALLPFNTLMFRGDWMLWWLVAQAVVVLLAASRSGRAAVVPVMGMVLSWALIVWDSRMMLVGPGVYYRFDSPGMFRPGQYSWTWTLLHFGVLAGALVVGRAMGVLAREETIELRLARRETSLHAAEAAQAERARLARDLHDVIAHHVSLIAVRAEAAPYTTAAEPSAMRHEFSEIAQDARRALDELRGILGVLHRSQVEAERSPQPSLGDVPDLIDRARAAGDQIATVGVDSSWVVPDAVGYVVYRLIQEALTNARKHARGAEVIVELLRDDDELHVTVSNTCAPGSTELQPGGPSGSGIPAMRERVEALNGALTAGPLVGGGFRVSARIPIFGGPR